MCAVCTILVLATDELSAEYPGTLAAISVLGAFMVFLIIVTALQPTENTKLTFKVPLVPLLPMLSVFFNLYLMFQLDAGTWVRFAVWIVIGYLIYFTYGIKHSVEGAIAKQAAVNGNGITIVKNGIDNNAFDGSNDKFVSTVPAENPRKSSKNSYSLNNE